MFDFIKLNPSVENIIVDGNNCSNIVDQYEDNKLIIFKDFDFGMNLEFLQSFLLSKNVDKGIKKAKFKYLLNSKCNIIKLLCKHDNNKAIKLSIHIEKILKLATNSVTKLFPQYKLLFNNCTLRCAETINEDLHLDSYSGQNYDNHMIRVFYNLDTYMPRFWKISHNAVILYEQYKNQLDFSKHPNLINSKINKFIKKDNDKFPKHEIFFPPRCLWLGNSQVISHEICYGRQMLAFTFYVDFSNMNNPSKRFSKILSW